MREGGSAYVRGLMFWWPGAERTTNPRAVAAIASTCFALLLLVAVAVGIAPLFKSREPATSVQPPRQQISLISTRGSGTCLDGSSPKYYLRQGLGSGNTSWILYLMGGGWCETWERCQQRSRTYLGSSSFWPLPDSGAFSKSPAGKEVTFEGMLSADPSDNPDFYHWNVAFVTYCDGGAYLGTRGLARGGKSHLTFNGQAALDQVLQDLVQRQGMAAAQQVVVVGASAGGHAVAVLCDWIIAHFPPSSRSKCIMDAGFFIDVPSSPGVSYYAWVAQQLEALHGAKVPSATACTEPTDTWRCLLPENSLLHMEHPVLIVNNLFDYATAALALYNGTYPLALTRDDMFQCITRAKECPPNRAQYLHKYARELRERVMHLVQIKDQESQGFAAVLLRGFGHDLLATRSWVKGADMRQSLREKVADWFFRDEGV